jgi:hypothetical protein
VFRRQWFRTTDILASKRQCRDGCVWAERAGESAT